MEQQPLADALISILEHNRAQVFDSNDLCVALTDETKELFVARKNYAESHGKHGFTNGNSDAQNESNKKIIEGESLSEQSGLEYNDIM